MKRVGVRPWVILLVVGVVLFVICVVGGVLRAFITAPKPDQEILDTMSVVCEGRGVEEAAAYIPGPGPHAIVVLDASGSGRAWTNRLPYEWWPKSINTTELVACLDEEQQEFVTSCEYSDGQTIRKYQYTIPIQLVAARSGETIASGVIMGEPPRACKIMELVDTTTIHGSHVTHNEVEQWLRKFVTP
ncbi:MAG: hypothetical protein QGM50_11625 [Anaerolineae bacterium]|nr:hypothetical protein [Anaerolineae bacterium]